MSRKTRQTRPIRPTLSILSRTDDTERLVFDCQHARTSADHLGGNGQTLRRAVREVLAQHATTCRCQPEVIEELWDSMAYMKASIERDLETEAATSDAATLAASRLASIARYACPCDPNVVTSATLGVLRFTAYHREGCAKKLARGRYVGVLDFTQAVA